MESSSLHATIGDANYTTTVADNGTFRINVVPPKAISPITVYVETSSMKSADVKSAVRKTGPDAAQIDVVYIGDTLVT